jgi:hypothetical protein
MWFIKLAINVLSGSPREDHIIWKHTATILPLGKRHLCSPGRVRHHIKGLIVLKDDINRRIAPEGFMLDWTLTLRSIMVVVMSTDKSLVLYQQLYAGMPDRISPAHNDPDTASVVLSMRMPN